MDSNEILHWLTDYGSVALFFILILGFIILPVPQNGLLMVAGVLIAKGILSLYPTVFSAYAGTICGITITYLIGIFVNTIFLERYGYYIGITPIRLNRFKHWYERIGKWTLCIGYFFPIIRRITGYAAGMSKLRFRLFAIFAYSGAVIWASIFLAIGYFIGDEWRRVVQFSRVHFYILSALIIAGVAIYFILKMKHRKSFN